MRFLERALEVTTDPLEEFALRTAAGDAALFAGLVEEPHAYTARALELARELGDDRGRILSATLERAFALGVTGHMAEDVALLEAAQEEFPEFEGTQDWVRLSAELARGTLELLITRGAALAGMGRPREGTIVLMGAVSAASSAGIPTSELRGRVNLSYAAAADDPELAYRTAREGLELSRKLGMRGYAYYLLGNAAEMAIRMGDWDWALAELEEAVADSEHDTAAQMRRAEILGLRGHDVAAELQGLADLAAGWTELQAQSSVGESRALVALARGELRAALDLAQAAYRINAAPDGTGMETAIRAASGLRDGDAVTDALRVLEPFPGRVTTAVRHEGEAVLAGIAGRRKESLAGFLDAIHRWKELGLTVEVALAQLTLVTVLGATDAEARTAAEEARVVFERVGSPPLLDRLAAAVAAVAAPEPAADRARTPQPG
jgi:tetratricopeptide (TPR) repeat protein